MKTLSVDVVVPTWNRAELVLGCLGSLSREAPHTAIVVDNGSSDGTVDRVGAAFPDTRIVAFSENRGFGRAVNAGIAAGSGEIVVLLNNDVTVLPGFLEAIVAPFGDPRVASVSGVLLSADGSAIDAAGVVADNGLAGYSHLHSMPVEVFDLRGQSVSEPLGPCGGAAAYRREALAAVGVFDEEIFAYSEDLELALRLSVAGHRSALAHDARALHLGSATAGPGSPFQLRLAGWARGYILGRYRVGLGWVALELLIASITGLRTRSLVPVAARVGGLRRGYQLQRKPRPEQLQIGLIQGLRLRLSAVR